jgi:hypothetical protein
MPELANSPNSIHIGKYFLISNPFSGNASIGKIAEWHNKKSKQWLLCFIWSGFLICITTKIREEAKCFYFFFV